MEDIQDQEETESLEKVTGDNLDIILNSTSLPIHHLYPLHTALCGYPLLKFPEENFFLRPHFLEIQLFQTEYLGNVFCTVSLLIYL